MPDKYTLKKKPLDNTKHEHKIIQKYSYQKR